MKNPEDEKQKKIDRMINKDVRTYLYSEKQKIDFLLILNILLVSLFIILAMSLIHGNNPVANMVLGQRLNVCLIDTGYLEVGGRSDFLNCEYTYSNGIIRLNLNTSVDYRKGQIRIHEINVNDCTDKFGVILSENNTEFDIGCKLDRFNHIEIKFVNLISGLEHKVEGSLYKFT